MERGDMALYQDDEAADLRETISLMSKMPADGERILEILPSAHRLTEPSADLGIPSPLGPREVAEFLNE
jgi:hypothetical protein